MDFPKPGTFDIVDFPSPNDILGKVFDPSEYAKPMPAILAWDPAAPGKNEAVQSYYKTDKVPLAKPLSGHQPDDPYAPKPVYVEPLKPHSFAGIEIKHIDFETTDWLWSSGPGLGKSVLLADLKTMKNKDFIAQMYGSFSADSSGVGAMMESAWMEQMFQTHRGHRLEPVSTDIEYRPFTSEEVADTQVFKQAFFDRAVDAMMRQQCKATNTVSCLYRAPNGARCVVGWMIPDETYHYSLEGYGVTAPAVLKAMGLPVSFGDASSPVFTFIKQAQKMLHDGISDYGSRDSFNDKLLRNISILAEKHGLAINVPILP